MIRLSATEARKLGLKRDPQKGKQEQSHLESLLLSQIRVVGLPEPEREVRFCGLNGKRRWRFDFAWHDRHVLVEVEGGQFIRGRHQRPLAFEQDCIKYSEASMMGWLILRFTGRMVKSGAALALIERALK